MRNISLSFCHATTVLAAHLVRAVIVPAVLLVASANPLPAAAQSAAGVSLSTDSPTYNVGDPIQVTIANDGTDRITRGGLACDDLWPLAIEQQGPDGNWQPVGVPTHQCIGIAGVVMSPGQSQSRTVSPALDPGTYHLVYSFSIVGSGAGEGAVSDAFDVVEPGAGATK